MLYLIIFSGICWLVPFCLFLPAVIRVWRRDKASAIDVILSPVAFVAANQIGYVARWLIYPHAISTMTNRELIMWSGLYTLSSLSALALAGAWRIARRLR
jgi:hypothetical protein